MNEYEELKTTLMELFASTPESRGRKQMWTWIHTTLAYALAQSKDDVTDARLEKLMNQVSLYREDS